MPELRFSSARQVIRHCQQHEATVRSVVTDLRAVAPRVYVICSDRTFMLRPEEVPELVGRIRLSDDVLSFLAVHGLLSVEPSVT